MTNAGPSESVFKIPDSNLESFKSRFAKIARKAVKLGIEVPVYAIVGEEVQGTTDQGRKAPVLLHLVTITSPVVKVNGYTFIATIEHTEEGNILHSHRSTVIPLQYRTVQPLCQHCNTVRRRRDTFLVQNDTTLSYMQVGRNCLCDFLGGKSAEHIAAQAELGWELSELGEASESYSGSGGRQFDYLDAYLGFVAECIARDGWLSRSAAKDRGCSSTSDDAYRAMHPSPFDRIPPAFREPSSESIAMATASIEWATAITDEEAEKSDYLYTIRLIARRGIVGDRHYGYAASIVSSYQRFLGDVKRREREARATADSNFVGEVGKRLTFHANVEKAISLPDYGYGSSTLYIMYDQNGNCLTWKSSASPFDAGDQVVLKGTIKGHDTYNGRKQTTLTRCKLESKVSG